MFTKDGETIGDINAPKVEIGEGHRAAFAAAVGLGVPEPEPELPGKCHCGIHIYRNGTWDTQQSYCGLCGDKLLPGGYVERHQAEVRE
jgi:hypothetical protein